MNVSELIEKIGRRNTAIGYRLNVNAQTVARWRRGQTAPMECFRGILCKLAGVEAGDVTWERTERKTDEPNQSAV